MHEMQSDEAQSILKASRFGVLSLAHEDDAYSIPLFYGYDGEAVYFQCHPGVKDEWIASTKDACLVVIHMESENIWESVQVFGSVEKLSLNSDIQKAQSALYHIPFPPAEGFAKSGNPIRSDQDVFYLRLNPSHLEGKASTYKE